MTSYNYIMPPLTGMYNTILKPKNRISIPSALQKTIKQREKGLESLIRLERVDGFSIDGDFIYYQDSDIPYLKIDNDSDSIRLCATLGSHSIHLRSAFELAVNDPTCVGWLTFLRWPLPIDTFGRITLKSNMIERVGYFQGMELEISGCGDSIQISPYNE